MIVLSNTGTEISSLEEWREFASPASEKHWKDGRSAAELARSWIEGDAEARVTQLMGLQPLLVGTRLTEAVAEKKTHFDTIGRGPRNHDLLVRGTTAAGPLVVGVEGKADEAFDLPLSEWLEVRTRDTSASQAPARLDRLSEALFSTTLGKTPEIGALGYQLLSAAGGTLADAKTEEAEAAVLLIHEFVTPETSDAKHAVNAQALEAFVSRLGPAERVGDTAAWLAGPWPIHGDGTWLPSALPLFVGKLITRTR